MSLWQTKRTWGRVCDVITGKPLITEPAKDPLWLKLALD